MAAEAKAPWTKPQRTDEDGEILRKLNRNIKNTKKTWGDSIYIYIYMVRISDQSRKNINT